MVFSSLVFLFIFFPLTLALYFIVKNYKVKNIILVIASLIFYSWGEPVWVTLLIFSSILDYTVSHAIEKHRGEKITKLYLAISVVVNLGLLAAFKYSGFFVSSINSITGLSIPVPEFALPIGISFYTFQTMSYSIDVYRGNVKAQKSFINFLMFVSLFPQLIAGPIVRYSDIENQIAYRTITIDSFSKGMTRFMAGLGKKVLIANYAGSIATSLLNNIDDAAVMSVWFGVLFYSFQIYFDFSGYSDMAIGLGKMFGFDYPENFKHPYISTSITDFWRRWHITLSSFFRDYVYIPLGGNRVSIPRQILNLFIVWALTGLWHGASWNFVLWGLYYFVFLCLEKFVLKKFIEKIPSPIRWLFSMAIVLVGWMIFYFDNFSTMITAFSIAFGKSGNALTDPISDLIVTNNIPFILIACIASTPIASFIKKKINALHEYAEPIASTVYNILMLILCVASLAGSTYNPFLYFRF
ncbi:MAG: MBOAT family protein [Oscillospiraceae bacterium]|nr:MBOAT family protein [Oscillospiraceae bacterium]